MTKQSHPLFPCASFFSRGQFLMGFGVLLMQLSLVFWPAATRMAREEAAQSGLQRMLTEFSEKHGRPADPYSPPLKKFRQVA